MQKITTDDLQRMKNNDESFRLLNVLPEDAFQQEHIPGSENIPVERHDFLEQLREESRDPNERIVVYCADQACQASPKAAMMLEEAGFNNVMDYEGGMEAWKQAGNPVQTGAAG
jgi:rhodanese-related sulfurtransferase